MENWCRLRLLFSLGGEKVIQSSDGISFDQTEHILQMLEPHFPRSSSFTRTDTPFRTDRGYEQELMDFTPASHSELKLLEKEYGGSFATLYGQLLHVATISRPDISYALMRLGRFQPGPCRLGFEGLRKVFRFLASHPNIPIMYKKHSNSKSSSLLTYIPTSKPPVSICLPHSLAQMDDANFGTDLLDRKSISSNTTYYNGTIVSWKCSKQLSIATSTTDAEIRSLFQGLKKILVFRNFLSHLGFPESIPTSIFEDNQGTFDIVQAGRLTSRIKHLDIPLKYLHDQHTHGSFQVHQCSTHLMLADYLNKALAGPVIKRLSAINVGKRFYPKPNTFHHNAFLKYAPLDS